MRVSVLLCVCLLACWVLCSVAGPGAAWGYGSQHNEWIDKAKAAPYTALQEYVAKPDPHYGWVYNSTYDRKAPGITAHFVNMTSQRWLTDADVSKSIWFHYMYVFVPDKINANFTNNALMYMTGGHNDDTPYGWDQEDMIVGAAMALMTQTVVTVLFHIPNQPICFYEEKPKCKQRSEDGAIAWTWHHWIQDQSNPEWLLRLPMTKAGVRAMDATQEFTKQQFGMNIQKFMVAGASKRGWTTYTVGAADPVAGRIIGIVPMVLDELNIVKNLHHHWRAYGGWSFALKDYLELNFTQYLDSDAMAKAFAIVDPYVYKEALTMPKLIIDASGDEFGLPDDNLFWFPEFVGEKHCMIFPNIEHSMATNILGVLEAITGFAVAVQSNVPRPNYSWSIEQDGTVTAVTQTKPTHVKLWQANTIDGNLRRDFRLVVWNTTSHKPALHPITFTSTKVNPTYQNDTAWVYQVKVQPPNQGWVGFYLELDFAGVGGTSQTYSTGVSILPQTYPYPDCYMDTCVPKML